MSKKQILMFIFLIALFVPNLFEAASLHKSRGGDFRAFTVAADRLLDKSFMYQGSRPGSGVTWPLFFAFFMVPLTLLSKINMQATQVFWYCANCAMLFFSIGIWCMMVYQKKFDWFDYKKPMSVFSSFVFLPLLFIACPLLDNAVELQVNILQLFLISLGLLHIQKKHDIIGGFWFGLASAIKVYPLIFIFYLLYRRNIKAASMLVLTAVLLTVSPMLWYGPQEYVVNIKAWLAVSLHGGFPLGGAQQSVYSMLGTWITSDFYHMIHGKKIHPPLYTLGSQLTIWLHRMLFGILLFAFFFIVHRRKFKDTGFEGAFFTVMMVLFSPVSWKHYWVMTFPAIFVLWRVVLMEKNKVISKLLWISFVLIPVLEVIGSIIRTVKAFANSVLFNYTMAGFVLLAGLFYWFSVCKIEKPVNYDMDAATGR
jgi:hypothetical protein